MSSKGEIRHTPSFGRRIVAITIFCTIVGWASANALAQDALPTELGNTKRSTSSTSSSLKELGSEETPYLVIGLPDRWDTSRFGSFPMAGDDATDSSAGDTLTQHVGLASSVNRADNTYSSALVLSSLTNFQAKAARRRQIVQKSPQPARPEIYSLLDDGSAAEWFLYGHSANYLPPKEWLADSESPTHEIGQAPSPLLQFELGAWNFPVMLSNAEVAR
jgi:hypothetical protein